MLTCQNKTSKTTEQKVHTDMEIFTTIVYGVISSLVAAFLFEIMRSNSEWFPRPYDEPNYGRREVINDERARNRAKLHSFAFNTFFYCYTFFVVYAALLLPPVIKMAFHKNTLYLSDARFIGDLLPTILIASDYVQWAVVFIAFVLYIPLLMLSHALTIPIASIIDKFKPMNIYGRRKIQTVLFLLFACCLAVVSIYVFNETTFKNACWTFGAFLLLSLGIGLSNKR